MTAPSIFESIHKIPPVDTTYVAGRWHHDRATLQGFSLEARVYLKSLMTPQNDNKRFLVIGRARSGTTLLTRMLNGHSQIHCDGEVLKRKLFSPSTYFDRLAGKSRSPVFGAKFLSYQMVQVHRMRNPVRFLEALTNQGTKLIHLERNTFFQTLSLAMAQNRNFYHSDKGSPAPAERITLDPQNFVDRIKWSEALLSYEKAALGSSDHIKLSYEQNLADPSQHQSTLDHICNALNVPSELAVTPLKKVLPPNPRKSLENYDDICDALIANKLDHVVPTDIA